jgi:predicted SnoaL-like aldol condensation-catalyzing enzyme
MNTPSTRKEDHPPADRKTVEHWDVVQDVPETSASAGAML